MSSHFRQLCYNLGKWVSKEEADAFRVKLDKFSAGKLGWKVFHRWWVLDEQNMQEGAGDGTVQPPSDKGEGGIEETAGIIGPPPLALSKRPRESTLREEEQGDHRSSSQGRSSELVAGARARGTRGRRKPALIVVDAEGDVPFLAQFLPATRLAQVIGEARDAALAPEKKETLPGRRPLYASDHRSYSAIRHKQEEFEMSVGWLLHRVNVRQRVAADTPPPPPPRTFASALPAYPNDFLFPFRPAALGDVLQEAWPAD